jgi:hypothetical protein
MASRCAPGVSFNKYGSCYKEDQLKEFSQLNGIDPELHSGNVNALVQLLKEKYEPVCQSNESCWINQGKINKKLATEMTLQVKPELRGLEVWLNSREIGIIMVQHMRVYSDFLFLGPFAVDFDKYIVQKDLSVWEYPISRLLKSKRTKIGIIFNTDPHNASGKHWIALYMDITSKTICFFDSLARSPPASVKKLIAWYEQQLQGNRHTQFQDNYDNNNKTGTGQTKTQLQGSDTNTRQARTDHTPPKRNKQVYQKENSQCGMYSVHFILEMCKGISFEDFLSRDLPDGLMAEYRKLYFSHS